MEAAIRHYQAGRWPEAERLYGEILKIDSENPDILLLLGTMAHQAGENDLAARLITKAVALKPAHPEAHNNLGNVYRALGRLDQAVASYRKALDLRADFSEVHGNLGNVLKDMGRMEDAVSCYEKAVALKPNHPLLQFNFGVALQALGRFDEAAARYQKALGLHSNFPEAHGNLGDVFAELGRMDDAIASYGKAIALKPDYAEAHNNMGSVLRGLGRLEEAIGSFSNAIALKPDFSEAYGNLGGALKDSGRVDEAQRSYRRALDIAPQAIQHAIHAQLLLPPIPESVEAIHAWRERYLSGLEELMNAPQILEDPTRNVSPASFYLAYHDRDDRPVMAKLHKLFRDKAPSLTATAPHVPDWRAPVGANRRIRVGFLSEYLVEHTIGKLYRGYIRHLDRRRFEVIVIYPPKAKHDAVRRQIEADADKSLSLPVGLVAQQQAVALEKLDVLFYPDIGMAPGTYFLAFSRLAPVQAVAWGHPDTTGLDSMDYFVSAASIEPEVGDSHYSERLIRLNRLPCFFEPLVMPAQSLSRAALGLPETGTLYGCPQSLFKFHPDFDPVLAAIADGDRTGHIVLLEGATAAWTDMLRSRWRKTFPDLLSRILFLPRMPMERFLALMARMDVLLDPLHFGAGNSFYEATLSGTPVVTWPGRFMRGRIVSGAYAQMGLVDAPIARRIGDYASLALAWGRDPERRHAFRSAFQAAAVRELLADSRAVREFEDFLTAAVNAADQGEKLPAGWGAGKS